MASGMVIAIKTKVNPDSAVAAEGRGSANYKCLQF